MADKPTKGMLWDAYESTYGPRHLTEVRCILKTEGGQSVMLRVRDFPSTILLQVKDHVLWDHVKSLSLARQLNDDLLEDAKQRRFNRRLREDEDEEFDKNEKTENDNDDEYDDDAWRTSSSFQKTPLVTVATCPRTHCSCGAGNGHMSLSSEPCRMIQKADEEAVVVGRTRLLDRWPLIGWRAKPARYIEFHLSRPCYARAAKRILERYIVEMKWYACEPANVIPDAVLALLQASDALDRVGTVETGMTGFTGGAWLSWNHGLLPVTTYERVSTCDYEYVISSLGNELELCQGEVKTAPLRLVSYDIECSTVQGKFPDAQHNEVLMIAMV